MLIRFIAAFTLLSSLFAQAADKPNILFIFADDQCYETVRALGHTDIDTPNLDRLVNAGTTFTHAYNMGSWSGAVCVASRNMLNTGRFIWRAQKVSKGPAAETERAAGRYWGEHMKAAGYETYFTGKWHVAAKAEKCFKHARHVRPGMPNQTKEGYNRPIDGQPDPWSPYDPKFEGFWKGGTHWSVIVADDAVDFLDDAKKQDKPFFMYIAFNAPHDPRQSPKKYVDMYPLDRIKVPENFLPEYPYKDPMKCPAKLRDEKLAPFPRTHNSIKVNRQEYYAIITHMDEQIGRILDKLEVSGMKKNTYIFFSADHGLGVGRHGLLGKQNMYDHSVRVPFFVVGPDVPKGKKIASPVYLQDIMASSLDLAGIEKPDHVEFNSVMPIVRGKTDKSAYDAVYGAYLDAQRMVTQDGYKLIMYPSAKVTRLYDLQKDPFEKTDLAGNPEYKPRMKQLFARFLKLQQEMGDGLDVKSVYPGLM